MHVCNNAEELEVKYWNSRDSKQLGPNKIYSNRHC
jgi:hypothetical protein